MQILLIDVRLTIYQFICWYLTIKFSTGKISPKEETWFIYTNNLDKLVSNSLILYFRDKREGCRILELDKGLGSEDQIVNLLYPFFPSLPMDPEHGHKSF